MVLGAPVRRKIPQPRLGSPVTTAPKPGIVDSSFVPQRQLVPLAVVACVPSTRMTDVGDQPPGPDRSLDQQSPGRVVGDPRNPEMGFPLEALNRPSCQRPEMAGDWAAIDLRPPQSMLELVHVPDVVRAGVGIPIPGHLAGKPPLHAPVMVMVSTVSGGGSRHHR